MNNESLTTSRWFSGKRVCLPCGRSRVCARLGHTKGKDHHEKGRVVCRTVYGDMYLKDLLGSVARVGYYITVTFLSEFAKENAAQTKYIFCSLLIVKAHLTLITRRVVE